MMTITIEQKTETRTIFRIGPCGRTALGPDLPLRLETCQCYTGDPECVCPFSESPPYRDASCGYTEMKSVEALTYLLHCRFFVDATLVIGALCRRSDTGLVLRFAYEDGSHLQVEYEFDGSLPRTTITTENSDGLSVARVESRRRISSDLLSDAKCYLSGMFPEVQLDL